MFEVSLPDKIPDKYLISDISPIKVTMCHFEVIQEVKLFSSDYGIGTVVRYM